MMLDQRAIIIAAYPSRDADLMLHCLSETAGKLVFLARNSRSSKRRYGSHFDVFDCGVFSLKKGKGGMLLVDSFKSESSYSNLRSSLDQLVSASLVCECFSVLSHECEPKEAKELFDLLDLTLKAISENATTKSCLRNSFLGIGGLLQHCGYTSASDMPSPSAKGLMQLLSSVETNGQRALKSKQQIVHLMQSVKNAA